MRLPMTPGRWVLLAVAAVVVLAAASAYTSRSDFCGSCHDTMGEHYRSWSASSHGDAAECLDCHTEPGWVGYYHGKLEGVRNALSQWFGVEKADKAPPPGPASCMRDGCHTRESLTGEGAPGAPAHTVHVERVACVRCHGDIGHRPSELERAAECVACHGGDPEGVGR